jgi:hypothetical protein
MLTRAPPVVLNWRNIAWLLKNCVRGTSSVGCDLTFIEFFFILCH